MTSLRATTASRILRKTTTNPTPTWSSSLRPSKRKYVHLCHHPRTFDPEVDDHSVVDLAGVTADHHVRVRLGQPGPLARQQPERQIQPRALQLPARQLPAIRNSQFVSSISRKAVKKIHLIITFLNDCNPSISDHHAATEARVLFNRHCFNFGNKKWSITWLCNSPHPCLEAKATICQ